ncbi:serine dehydratase beta chain [Melghirimyces algeriensis]|uniref:L-serine ammonia-lyase n=1 Tax=Melghirimyces algeriensis TaxID=910412 RepID=A0A521EQY5_9BACL|nr:serine dehydratase beta chain [Melghirimyces algeriensis]SMO85520.1 L-serine dehydratase, iron-sulfur-dependent, beta subunit [Melghirimyces algeriensis]
MEFNSCFDIIGPVMVGPSSSHTAGVVAIGKFVYDYMGGIPDRAEVVFYDSFAETYQGHGTDKAIVGGLLGMEADDLRIRDALDEANKQRVNIAFHLEAECPDYPHPNTVLIQAERLGERFCIGGVSLGGGLSKIYMINGSSVDILLNGCIDFEQLKKYRLKK